MTEKGGAVAGANSDNYRLPNRAGSEQDARKACSDMDRMPQNHAGALHRRTPCPVVPMDTGNAQQLRWLIRNNRRRPQRARAEPMAPGLPPP